MRAGAVVASVVALGAVLLVPVAHLLAPESPAPPAAGGSRGADGSFAIELASFGATDDGDRPVEAAVRHGESLGDAAGHYPTVRIRVPGPEGAPDVCSGISLTPRHVATAAHCVDEIPAAEVVVEQRPATGGEATSVWTAVAVTPHPDWTGEVGDLGDTVDLAVVTLPDDADLVVAPLADHGFVAPQLADGTQDDAFAMTTRLTGWGATRVDGPPSDGLRAALLSTTLASVVNCGTDGPLLCSTPVTGSACFGDSGAPLWVDDANERPRVVGLVSAGAPTCAGVSYEINLLRARPWLEATTGGLPSTAPAPPADLTVEAADASATVTYGPPPNDGGASVVAAEVRLDGVEVVGDHPLVGSVAFDGLTNGHAHVVEVRVRNEVGASAWTSATVIPIGPTPPPAPASVSVSVDGIGLQVSWSPVADADGTPADRYEIELSELDTAGSGSADVPRVVSSSELSIDATDLSPGAHYLVRVRAHNPHGWGPWSPPIGPVAAPSDSGYWLLDADGGLHSFGNATPFDQATSAEGRWLDAEAASGVEGLWLLSGDGRVETVGDAQWFGDLAAAQTPTGDPAAIAAHPDGDGYWVITTDGVVWAFGGADFVGDLGSVQLNAPIVDAVATPSGEGYYLVSSDGGVFAFGDAGFHGSTGAMELQREVVSLIPDPDGVGYWLIALDGGVFAFAAPYRGSVPQVLGPGAMMNEPVVGGVGHGDGYLLVAGDGGVFNFSSEPFLGSLATAPPVADVVTVTSAVRGRGAGR